MATVESTAPGAAGPVRRGASGALAACALAVVVFLIAVLPRLANISLFITPDEDNWMRRTGNFARAIERGDLVRTFQSGHPGVVTMWVAWLGIGPEASRLAGITGPDPMVTRLAGFVELLARARTAFAATNSVLIVGIVLLVLRLWGTVPAWLAGGLLAWDPFLVAHGQVVHLDALASGLMMLAMLSGAVFWRERSWRFLALCGVATGLAVATKAPSMFLAVFVPIIALSGRLAEQPRPSWRWTLGTVAACGAAALATLLAVWPAMWVAPVDTVSRWIEYTLVTAEAPHGPGNFFLGTAVADPGAWFYPVAVAMRLTPIVVVGLACFAIARAPSRSRWQSMMLFDFMLGFLLFVTLAGKKLDRYALPMFPSLDILAALGIWCVASRLGLLSRTANAIGMVVIVAGVQAASLWSSYPYPLAYYNPLLGGINAAQRTLLVGWGEGLDQVANYLNAQPNAESSRIAVYYPLTINFQGMVRGTVQSFGAPQPADYVVDYINAAQRRQTPREVSGLTADFTATIHGVTFARVYRLSTPRAID
ncbi:MAG: glycosyltransferase family 39 protein [Chloroflexota bacterium]